MLDNRKIRVKLVFREEKSPYLLDISSLLYDFELLHDFSLILFAEDYYGYRFTRYFWRRKGRPLKREHKIRAYRIIKESPLTVELILSSIAVLSGAFWILVQAIEKISNWRLNREKLELEIENLKRELNLSYYEEERARVKLEQALYERKAEQILLALLRRLESNPIKLEDMDVLVE